MLRLGRQLRVVRWQQHVGKRQQRRCTSHSTATAAAAALSVGVARVEDLDVAVIGEHEHTQRGALSRCFCRGGKDIAVFTSHSGPMGPFELQGSVNPLVATHPYGNGTKVWHEYALPCQQAHVAALPFAKDEHGEAQLVWIGDGWQQAPDGRKDHDPQFWVPLRFDAAGTLLNMTRVMNWTAVN